MGIEPKSQGAVLEGGGGDIIVIKIITGLSGSRVEGNPEGFSVNILHNFDCLPGKCKA